MTEPTKAVVMMTQIQYDIAEHLIVMHGRIEHALTNHEDDRVCNHCLKKPSAAIDVGQLFRVLDAYLVGTLFNRAVMADRRVAILGACLTITKHARIAVFEKTVSKTRR